MIYFEFRVHGIQSFIFTTNRLKEMVGASALVDQLTHTDIYRAIDTLGLDIARQDFARCAGGAFLVQIRDREQALNLRDFWLMFVSQKVPGLSFSHALHEAECFDQQVRAALKKELHLNHCRAVLTTNGGSPFAERAPRTGLPAVTREKGRLLDETSCAKRRAGTAGGQLEAKLNFNRDNLIFPLSFVPHEEQDQVDTLLAENESDQYIAVIHADVNGLGKVVEGVYEALRDNPQLFPQVPANFSKAIETATHKAVSKASIQIVDDLRDSKWKPHKKLVPLRFLVLGGDDVTLVIKASQALDWIKIFQTEFQKQAHQALKPFAKYGVPNQLTASAGVAFIKAKQPFHMAYHLAESLCSDAKNKGRNDSDGVATPTVAFHRITTAMIDDWDTVVKREKTTRDQRVLTMQPYANNELCNSKLATLSDLETLSNLLKQVGHGSVRELLQAFHQGKAYTLKAERRLYENLNNFKPKVLCKLKQVLADLGIPQPEDSLELFDAQDRTPLADAVAWHDIGSSQNQTDTQAEGAA